MRKGRDRRLKVRFCSVDLEQDWIHWGTLRLRQLGFRVKPTVMDFNEAHMTHVREKNAIYVLSDRVFDLPEEELLKLMPKSWGLSNNTNTTETTQNGMTYPARNSSLRKRDAKHADKLASRSAACDDSSSEEFDKEYQLGKLFPCISLKYLINKLLLRRASET